MKRRKRAIFTQCLIADMERYLGAPAIRDTVGFIHVVPNGFLSSVWCQQAIDRYKSFGLSVVCGFWDGEEFSRR